MVARQAHNLKVPGSNPGVATISNQDGVTDESTMLVVGLHLLVMVNAKEIGYVGGTGVRRCTTRETFEAKG